TDDGRADLTLAVEGEVIDITHQLARRVVYGLADEHPGKELVGRLLGDERQIGTGCAASLRQGLAGERSCCQGQGAGQTHDLTSHCSILCFVCFLTSNSSDLVCTSFLRIGEKVQRVASVNELILNPSGRGKSA